MAATPSDRRRPPAGRKPGPPGRNSSGPSQPQRANVLHFVLGAAVILVAVNFGYSVFRAPDPPAPAPVLVAPVAPLPPPPAEEPEPEPVIPTPTIDLTRSSDGQPIQD
jgi:hypothetical protein